MDLPAIYNCVEIGLWGTVGTGFLLRALRTGPYRKLKITAGMLFLLFAATEVIELRTGTWWRPWWLFTLKAVCVIGLAVLMILYARAQRDCSERSPS